MNTNACTYVYKNIIIMPFLFCCYHCYSYFYCHCHFVVIIIISIVIIVFTDILRWSNKLLMKDCRKPLSGYMIKQEKTVPFHHYWHDATDQYQYVDRPCMGILMVIKMSWDRLIFVMGMPILVTWHLWYWIGTHVHALRLSTGTKEMAVDVSMRLYYVLPTGQCIT